MSSERTARAFCAMVSRSCTAPHRLQRSTRRNRDALIDGIVIAQAEQFRPGECGAVESQAHTFAVIKRPPPRRVVGIRQAADAPGLDDAAVGDDQHGSLLCQRRGEPSPATGEAASVAGGYVTATHGAGECCEPVPPVRLLLHAGIDALEVVESLVD